MAFGSTVGSEYYGMVWYGMEWYAPRDGLVSIHYATNYFGIIGRC